MRSADSARGALRGRVGRQAATGRDRFAYSGRWRVSGQSATAIHGARLELEFGAQKVFLVLGSPGLTRTLRVSLDGRPIPDRLAGDDARDGRVSISAQRLYRLVDLPRASRHRLGLDFEPGISGYAFTFG